MRFGWLSVCAVLVLAPATTLAQTTTATAPIQSVTAPSGSSPYAWPTNNQSSPAAVAWSEGSTPWYGWQTLLTDSASVAFFVVAAEEGSSGVFFAGLGTYLLGGPIVHAAHGEGRKAGMSFGLRLASPLLSAGTGYLIGDLACSDTSKNREFPCPAVFALAGYLAGFVFASVLDASVLARQSESHSSRGTVRWVPSIAIDQAGAHLGLLGAF